jgi:hypothetical protein
VFNKTEPSELQKKAKNLLAVLAQKELERLQSDNTEKFLIVLLHTYFWTQAKCN